MKPIMFLALLCTGWLSTAMADMYVDKSIVVFESGQAPRQDVRVSNSSEDVMYVQVDAYVVENPGTDEEERIKITNPQVQKLVASPNKLVIPPGGQKLVRILNLEPDGDQERVYRINVTPIVPPLEEEVSQLRIVVAYQILTIVQPSEPRSRLAVERDGQQLIFTNEGNTNVLLSDGRQCSPVAPAECEELMSYRVYAGNSWRLDLPYDAPVSYSVRSFDGIKNEVFP